jgi:hypothetical protein
MDSEDGDTHALARLDAGGLLVDEDVILAAGLLEGEGGGSFWMDGKSQS